MNIRIKSLFFALALLFQSMILAPAQAADALVLNTSNGTFSAWNQSSNWIFLNKITGVVGAGITLIKSGWSFGITTEASNNTVYIFDDVSGAPGSVVATFTYSSNDGANWASYTGSYTVPSSGVFWLGQRSATGISNAGGALANQITNGWSISYSGRYSGTTLTGPFTYNAVYSAPVWQIYTGAVATALSAPFAPNASSTSSSIGVSETSTTANASSYLIKLFASNGTTLIDSKTATNSSILSSTTFTGLSPNTNYKVGVIAVGDGTSYSNSPLSSLTTISTSMGSSTVSTAVVGNPIQLSYRTTYQLRATTTGSTGYVTFKSNGKQITSCKKVTISALIANCNWRPSLHGVITISSTFTSTDANYNSATAAPLSVSVVSRSNAR